MTLSFLLWFFFFFFFRGTEVLRLKSKFSRYNNSLTAVTQSIQFHIVFLWVHYTVRKHFAASFFALKCQFMSFISTFTCFRLGVAHWTYYHHITNFLYHNNLLGPQWDPLCYFVCHSQFPQPIFLLAPIWPHLLKKFWRWPLLFSFLFCVIQPCLLIIPLFHLRFIGVLLYTSTFLIE